MKNTIKEIDKLLAFFSTRQGEAELKFDLLAEVAESLDEEIALIDEVLDSLQEERGLCELIYFCRTGHYLELS